jgi:hypothetical protein
MLGVALIMLSPNANAQVTNVNINSPGSNPYVIAAGSGDYHFTGSGTATANRINVANGYHGTITLENVNIVCPIDYAPMRLYGTYNGSNDTPTTMVNLILKGNNFLNSGNGANTVAAGLQVDQGAQVDISAIDPENNASGYLKADSRNTNMSIAGAAGIGGPCVENTSGDGGPNGLFTGTYMSGGTTPVTVANRKTTGGNIVITSGIIVAQGGNCGAGIGGGGWTGLYRGNIVITGGDVTATGGVHSPGIGGGCDQGGGNNGTYVPNTCVIAVPPAKITATTPNAGKGLSGAETILYIGDPQSPKFTVYTEDYRATTMYLDLSEDLKVKAKLEQFAPTLDPQRMYLGESRVYPGDGLTLWNPEFSGKNIVQNYGTFTSPTITFFTDAKNDKGFEYLPKRESMTANIKVELHAPVYEPTMTMAKYVPPLMAVAPMDTSDLLVGYSTAEAIGKAATLTFKNDGNTDLYNPVIDVAASYHTAIDGTSLAAAINAALEAALLLNTDGDGNHYLAPGDQFQVLARLDQDLGVGTYTGVVRFDADNVPPAMIKPIPFSVNVVRIMLPPPTLATVPPGITQTNSSVNVEATFDREVTGLTDGDIQITGGVVSGMAPVGASPSDKWRFTVTPAVGLLNGQYIQLYAKQNVAYDAHLIRTDDKSNTLSLRYNTDKPFATLSFPYDIVSDSVFVTAQGSFTFTVTSNGSDGLADPDSLWNSASFLLTSSLASPVITIEKDGTPYTDWTVTAYNWDAVAGVHVITVTTNTPDDFSEGAYRIKLSSGLVKNNMGNLMDETVSGFYVRIPTIVPGPLYPISYGIVPDPTSLPYPGGSVLLTVHGEHLQYAEALGMLKIELPPALFGYLVTPHAAPDGLTATFSVTLPANSTVTPISHPFRLLLNGVMPDPDAIGYTTVTAAPSIVVDPVDEKWFGHCEYIFTATIPDNGATREVNLTYLGLAADYLVMRGGIRPPAKVTLRSGETQLYLVLKTLRVPDNLNGESGAIIVSSPGLPSDTSSWFQFYNSPNLDDMVYIPPTTMFAGTLELNIKGGSPKLERSFDDVRWESAWLPITPLQLSNLESRMIYFREPEGCDGDMHFPFGLQGDDGRIDPDNRREVVLPSFPDILTDPEPGNLFVASGGDFTFTITLTGPYAGMYPEVTTNRKLLSDEESVTTVPLGNGVFRVTIHAIREPLTIAIQAVVYTDPEQGIEAVKVPRVWSSNGQIYVYAALSGEANIYTLTGSLVKSLSLAAGEISSAPLATGFYVVVTLSDGKTYKVIVR